MTPIIDIVFLLIIFFMLVCQFIVAENFELNLPDQIESARQKQDIKQMVATVTITKDTDNTIIFAVGSNKIVSTDPQTITNEIANAIDTQLKPIKHDKKIASLRIDKQITYKHCQIALAAVSQSIATDIQLAVIKN